MLKYVSTITAAVVAIAGPSGASTHRPQASTTTRGKSTAQPSQVVSATTKSSCVLKYLLKNLLKQLSNLEPFAIHFGPFVGST